MVRSSLWDPLPCWSGSVIGWAGPQRISGIAQLEARYCWSWFSLNSNGERNEMISSREFSYQNRRSHKWRSTPKSRFPAVAKMLDISNLRIQVQIKTQFLSPNAVYGVHLVFKFCDSRKVSNKPMYVNLEYEIGNESLHAYFATSRDDTWMTIELCRFLNHKEDVDFEVLLESFSRYYCGSGAIYVEGIEFQAINNVKHEEYENLKEVQSVLSSNPSTDSTVQQLPKDSQEMPRSSEGYVPDDGKEEPHHIPVEDVEKFWLSNVDGKKCLMLSAEVALYKSSNDKFFNRKTSPQSRFEEVFEVLKQQVIVIKCKIESQMLSPDTDYACFLVFKLSEKCRGLHCPVKVRDLLHRKNKEIGITYFRFPSAWNLHDIDSVPRMREDGWMEVNVWKFNSNSQLVDDCIPIRCPGQSPTNPRQFWRLNMAPLKCPQTCTREGSNSVRAL
ncbi:hypothetical protein OSB04_014044 [Centaurea solstitialis]|uniref:Uncharacterized protein n=1 Tax=Centaurea solstitialis TaxID=347529 RepID=A0AA38WNY1_9ASTR|nr:hypothetical protein OSB04_014044 [Centaurea solstitialis]